MNSFFSTIRKKGLLDFVWYGFWSLVVGRYIIIKMKIFWLKLRGFDLDYSVIINNGTRFFQSHKHTIKIASHCIVGVDAVIKAGFEGKIEMEEGVSISESVFIDIHDKLKIGKNSIIAPYCFICDYDHKFAKNDVPINRQGLKSEAIMIGEDVWIGAKSIILKGVTIGKGSVIGAGSVVTHDIPPYCVAAGNPARVIKKRK